MIGSLIDPFLVCFPSNVRMICELLIEEHLEGHGRGLFKSCIFVEHLGYRLDDRGSRVRFPAGAGNFSLHHRVQNGSGAHPAPYPMGARGSFPEGKEAEA
jgi:hypothetical protein